MVKKIFVTLIFISFVIGCAHQAVHRADVVRGNQLVKMGRYSEAAAYYRLALKKKPDSHVARINLGMVLAKSGDCEHAIFYLRKALVKAKSSFEARYYLAHCYTVEGKFKRAKKQIRIARRLKQRHVKAINLHAWLQYLSAKYKSALHIVERARKIDPKDVRAVVIEAKIHIALRHYKRAMALLKRHDSKRLPPRDRSFIYSTLGEAFAKSGQVKTALSYHSRALEMKPFAYESLVGGAAIFLKLNKRERAISLLNQAVNVGKSRPEAFFYLAKAHEKVDASAAVRYYRRFVRYAKKQPKLKPQLKESFTRISVLKRKE